MYVLLKNLAFLGWFDDDMTEEAREALRKKCLQSLAPIMIQVNATRHTKAGSPIYDNAGDIKGVGSFRIPNPAACDEDSAADFSEIATTEKNKAYCEIGASDNERAYLLSMLDRHPKWGNDLCHGADKLLRLLVDWASAKHVENDFVLTHPDLDLQNILIDKHGNVTGLVDWDGVTMVPRSIGCSFPKWLSRDWDPECYRWYCDRPSSDPSQYDHSPDQMNYYRQMYAQCFEAASTTGKTEQRLVCNQSTVRQSVLFDNLRRAVARPNSLYFIVFKISDLIRDLTSQTSFKSAANCIIGEVPERQSAEDHRVYESSALKRIAGHINAYPESQELEDSDEESKSLLAETTTKDSASTAGSNSKTSSEDSKSSCSTNLTSESSGTEEPLMIKSYTPHPALVFSDGSPGRSRKVAAIDKASREDVTITSNPLKLDQTSNLGSSAASSPGEMSSKSPSKLRRFCKSLHRNIATQRKKLYYRPSDSSGVDSVVVDGTVFGLVNVSKSFPATVATNSIRQASESKSPLGDFAVFQSAIVKVDAYPRANGSLEVREPSRASSHSDQSKTVASSNPVADQNQHKDIQGTSRGRESSSEISHNDPSASSETSSSPGSADPSIKHEGKVGLARRMGHILASTCETSDTNSDVSTVPCREIKKSHLQNTGSSKTKQVKRWLKDTFHKGRTSQVSSATSADSASYTPASANPPHISQISSMSVLGNVFQDIENEGTSSTKVPDSKKGPPGQYRILPSGAKAWDLQNLEPIDKELLKREGFMTHQIFKGLADDTLDEARMQRLKAGFLALLDSL